MTKKDYILIANVLGEIRENNMQKFGNPGAFFNEVNDGLIRVFMKDNPKFSLNKWSDYIISWSWKNKNK